MTLSKLEDTEHSKEFDSIYKKSNTGDVYRATRKIRRFASFTAGAIVYPIQVNRPIKVNSILCYVDAPTLVWWISFDEISGSVPVIDTNFINLNVDLFPTMLMAIQTQPAPITYRYFERGFPVNNSMYFALRNIAGVLQAPVLSYVEIDYEQMP